MTGFGGSKKHLRDLLLISMLTIFVAELGCRLVMPQPGFFPFSVDYVDGLKIPHPTRGFAYAPGFSGQRVTEDFSHTLRINSLGLRDREVSKQDRDRPKILALGNSFTAGIGVESEETWPAQLEQLLAASDGQSNTWRVINAGVSAYNLRQIRLLGEELVPLIQPDIVIVSFLVDDHERMHDPYVFFNGTTVRSSLLPKLLPLENGFLFSPFWKGSAIRLDFILDRYFWLGGHGAKVLQRLREPTDRPAASNTISIAEATDALAPVLQELLILQQQAASKGIPVLLLLCNWQRPGGEFAPNARILNSVVRKRFETNGLLVIDPLEDLESTHRRGAAVRFPNDAHWTPLGHRIVAESVRQKLTEALAQR